MRKTTRKRLLRLIPILMQAGGAIGAALAGFYSVSWIMKYGIWNPNGRLDPDMYESALLLTSIPALIALIGWLWASIGYLLAPVRESAV